MQVIDDSPELVGRDAELSRLRALIGPGQEAGPVLVVLGDPGMGKTVLLADVAQRASSAGLQVLPVNGRESEAALEFAGLHQLLRPLLAGPDRPASPP